MQLTLPKDTWVKVSAPASIRLVNTTQSKGIDWKEEGTNDTTDGPTNPDIHSNYKHNINMPLTTRYVNLWIRSSKYSAEVDITEVNIKC